jgi:hypothetical protein
MQKTLYPKTQLGGVANTVAQTSKSAVSRVSKPADARLRTFCRLGSRRYSRFGNLRYKTPIVVLASLRPSVEFGQNRYG